MRVPLFRHSTDSSQLPKPSCSSDPSNESSFLINNDQIILTGNVLGRLVLLHVLWLSKITIIPTQTSNKMINVEQPFKPRETNKKM